MYRYKRMARTIVLYGISLFLVASYPLTALADSVPSTPTTSSTTTAPAPAPTANTDYSYDATTGHWDTSKWWYNPITKSYEAVTPKPVVVAPPVTPNTIAPTSPTTNTVATTSATDTTNATITNGVTSQAQTGDAAVTKNTTAGNAGSGNASAVATVANVVNSTVNTGGSGPATFVENITGNVYGDIMLYPAMLAAMLQQPATTTTPPATTVQATTTTGIVNNVNLNATSGAAAVSGNTTAGNATSGTANAVASVMNIINSIVAANKSFIGTVNIYGNLNGDILVAPDFIPQLLASNAAANPTNVNSTNTTGIANNVTLAATTGTAAVANNTSAGNATTGTAKTNLVVLNLTGQQVVASNSLLVFVNVLGTWVGMIVNAPAGTTAAELGSGVTSSATTPQTLTTTTNSQITNNINLAAQSGNATVTGNTSAGGATTGNATSSAMILNLANSTLGLANWFGVLFINVFGTWDGSFGIDTASGNAPVAAATTPPTEPLQAIAFVAHADRSSRILLPSPTVTTTESLAPTPVDPPAVLGSTINNDVKKTTQNVTPSADFPLIAVILTSLGLAGVAWWIIATTRK